MGLDEPLALHKHPTGPAARVKHAALVRRQHGNEGLDDTARGVELAALLAFGTGELAEKVFVNAPEDILRAILLVSQTDGTDEIDQLTEPLLVQGGAGVVLGQHAFEDTVVPFDVFHGVIDQFADGGLLRASL